ncbi:uncharacterized protein BKA78DRAFT_309364 [Phyllosticta capitalensis]|uniref:uncharacterized protein n=1 Tax=Phyllosticta capitalensis TaxID=121624 RepID=UPI0031314167
MMERGRTRFAGVTRTYQTTHANTERQKEIPRSSLRIFADSSGRRIAGCGAQGRRRNRHPSTKQEWRKF